MYKRKPAGEYLVSVCTNTLCAAARRRRDLRPTLSETLGVGTTRPRRPADGKITLEHAECLAACDYAPVVTVNYEFFDNQTSNRRRAGRRSCSAGERPLPTRGAPLCSFKQISRQIAGFDDEAALALRRPGSPTCDGTGSGRAETTACASTPSDPAHRDSAADRAGDPPATRADDAPLPPRADPE